MMMQTPNVSLNPVTEENKDTLSQLLYHYQRELLPYSGKSAGDIQTYKYLSDYFTDPKRSAFFITVNNEIGGFVLINTHTLIESTAHSIAEFYVTPTFRRNEVGEQAAALALRKFPGRWEVAQMEANQPAVEFWRKVIKKITHGHYQETPLNTEAWHGPVLIFDVA